ICCNARVSACSIEDRAVRTRASCSERAALQCQNIVSAGFGRLSRPLKGVDDTLHPLHDWSGRFGLFRRLECCLPGLVQLIQTRELLFQTCGVPCQLASGYQQTNAKIFPGELEPVKHVEGRTSRQEHPVVSDSCVDFTCQ